MVGSFCVSVTKALDFGHKKLAHIEIQSADYLC